MIKLRLAVLAAIGIPALIFAALCALVLGETAVSRATTEQARENGLPTGSVPGAYQAAVDRAGSRCPEITTALIAAQLAQESGFDPTARSAVGAEGIAQFMPATWLSWGKDYSGDGRADVWNADDAIGSQADYMCGLVSMIKSWINQHRVSGDPVRLALAAYNAGPAAVLGAHGMPSIPEAESYATSILTASADYAVPADAAGGTAVETAIAAAEAEDHDRYVFGAAGPDAWDCSSLVQHAWQAAGVQLPRTTFEQVESPRLQRVPWQDRRRGDLIYFHIDGAAEPDHVGLILDAHQMFHASHPHPDPEDDIVKADYTIAYYLDADPIVMRVVVP